MPLPANLSSAERPESKPIVLIVEDVVLVRMLLSEMLRGRRFDIIEASTGEEAVRVIEAGFAVSVIMSDVYMPGAEMARWVKANRPDLKIVLGSGLKTDFDSPEPDLHAGPMLRKPYDLDEVESRLRQAIS
jgi:two-component system cell cycle sensor histidine kinase/response regulator CckA